MTIAHDATTPNTDTAGRSSASFAHTCTGSDLVLLIFIHALYGSGEPSVSAVTYNGVAATHVASITNNYYDTRHVKTFCYKLADPATGSNTLAVTYGQTNACDAVVAISYSGADDVGASATGSGASGNPTASVTTTVANAMAVGGVIDHGGDTDPFSPGSGVTERWDTATGTDTATDAGVWGGEKAAPTTGAHTIDCTPTVADDWAEVVVEVKPPAAGGNALPMAAHHYRLRRTA